MEYAALVALFDDLAATASTNDKRDRLAAAFADVADDDALLARLLTLVRGRLGPAYDRPELGVSSALTLSSILTATGAAEPDIRDRWQETGDLGDAAAWAAEHGGQQTLFSDSLTVERVHETLCELATYSGAGSQGRKVDALAGLVADASANEARYVVRLALGHLRLGVGEGTIRDAIAVAFLDGSEQAIRAIERAYQLTNDFRIVARAAREEGLEGLAALDIEPFRPIGSMLAEKAESLEVGLEDAADDAGRVRAEYKYDGIRVQVHVADGQIRLFTRRLEEITLQFPDVVRAVERGVTAAPVVLDGELVGYETTTERGDPRPVAFQQLSQRVKRERDVEAMAREVPVVFHPFDCLAEAETLVDRPLDERLERLEASLDPVEAAPEEGLAGIEPARARELPSDEPAAAETLYREALEAGHEGLMLKNPAASYRPGRRVGQLLKLKPTMEPLDLVVSRAQYSEGRRSELLGRLFLACYDPDGDRLREVGRLSTGYTDEELVALTSRLEDLITERSGRKVQLEPTVVLEVEYEEIQRSSTYASGYALRFPRFLGVREDLGPSDADTIDRVTALFDEQ